MPEQIKVDKKYRIDNSYKDLRRKNLSHKKKTEIKLGNNEKFTEDVYPNNGKCPECGGILITNFGAGISCTFCVDCDYNDYDYDL